MNKSKSIRRMIEQAIESCGGGSEMREVRARLEEAARAARRAESRERTSTSPPAQQWAFDIGTSSLRSLTRGQMERALGRLERMIGQEKKSLGGGGPRDIILE
jgi:hypothetical protein